MECEPSPTQPISFVPALQPFAVQKERALQERNERVASIQPLTAKERALECSVLRPAICAAAINSARSFLKHKGDYDASTLLSLLRRMPKGGHLHTHGVATGNFETLVEELHKNRHFYVWQGSDASVLEGTIKAFADDQQPSEGWVLAADVPKERLYKYITQSPDPSSPEACWVEFGALWQRLIPGVSVAPFYFGPDGFLWKILEDQLHANVTYMEIKEAFFAPWSAYDGTELKDDDFLTQFQDTVTQFRQEHPEFVGARVVLVCLKNQSQESIRDDFRRAVELKKKFPDFVAGFDLAGPEDTLKPIEFFAEVLDEEKRTARQNEVDLPLLLHAGETNVPDATQIFDAVLLGCERIGHGFALARHPTLIEKVKDCKISLECCPISNQVLGYVPDLANHPGLGLMRTGVPLTISSDDAGMWHHSDVSYDFAAVTKAWDLGLAELKALARNSLAFSTLRGKQREDALKAWELCWECWVEQELSQAGINMLGETVADASL